MAQPNSQLIEAIYEKLTVARDSRLRAICNGDPDAAVMSELLSAVPHVSPQSNIRYLAPGRSGAKVLVLLNPGSLPVVVKMGRASDIEREIKNYNDSLVEQRLPQEDRPTVERGPTNGHFAAVLYSWAGGWNQVQSFRDFFGTANEEEITRLLSRFMNDVFEWHHVEKLPDLPFDLWTWDDAAINQIRKNINQWTDSTETKEALLAALGIPAKWRDSLLTKRSGIGTCHGDLNCHNILIADLLPKLIDFASVLLHDTPARDWAKLERDIKLRCLKDLIPEPVEFSARLAQIDAAVATEDIPEDSTLAVRKAAAVVIAIRSQFRQLLANLSDIPAIEYLYFLLCWTLAYLNNQEGLAEPLLVQKAIVESAARTLGLLETEINRVRERRELVTDLPKKSHEPQKEPSASNTILIALANKFVSQLRIAGHVEDENHVRHAVYLDQGLYVHRAKQENAIMDYVVGQVDTEADGNWLSIIGDAGHGKSSLLWYVYTELNANRNLLVIPFIAQVDSDPSQILENVKRIRAGSDSSRHLVVLIDTLDMIVGVNDQILAATINTLLTLPSIVITTSRKQEADSLGRFVSSNHEVVLRRYTDAEAQEAIRSQVRVHYRNQTEAQQREQVDRVWGLLEQQRDVRELDLEPLILRMIFEAYVPAYIPQDINTQQVYRQYWHDRVLYDRVVESPEERFNREKLCRLIAREIAFGDGHSDKIAVDVPRLKSAELAGDDSLQDAIEKLVSSGVLQWAEGRSSVRFFHQTFFEYAAAYDILASDAPTISLRLSILLDAVANFNFFRSPLLKQLAIQSVDAKPDLHREIMERLRNVNNELAAQLALEIVGKVTRSDRTDDCVQDWSEKEPDVFQDVICETVRYYPKAKGAIALTLLKPFLKSDKETAIYSLLIDTFAKTNTEMVYEFLHPRLETIARADDDKKSYYKNALCAVAAHGDLRALDDLTLLLPKVKSGLQSAILRSIAEITTSENAAHVDGMVRRLADILPKQPTKYGNEVWEGLCTLISAVHRVSPDTARATAQRFLKTELWRQQARTALYVGRIAAETEAYEVSFSEALDRLRNPDHLVRMLNSGFLAFTPAGKTDELMELILLLDTDSFSDVTTIRSLFAVVGELRGLKPQKLLQFLEKWPWPASGAGTPLGQIFRQLAAKDPLQTKKWLLGRFHSTSDDAEVIKLIGSLTTLIEEAPDVFPTSELNEIYTRAFSINKSARQIFAAAIGAVAKVDAKLAEVVFNRVFNEEGKICQIAAVVSLQRAVQSQIDFTLSVGRTVLDTSLHQHIPGLLDNYVVILRQIPREASARVLERLDEWFTESVCNQVDTKILSELLAILKMAAETDPNLAFHISQRIPVLNKGIAGGLAALYDNVSDHSDDRDLLARVLEGFRRIAAYSQLRMRNALRRSLPRLGRKLGSAKVIEMVMHVYAEIEDEQALRVWLRAAIEIPGWGPTQNSELLRDQHLPGTIRSLLSTRSKT
jgi:hypothetical protein